jgi:hypothetical protein
MRYSRYPSIYVSDYFNQLTIDRTSMSPIVTLQALTPVIYAAMPNTHTQWTNAAPRSSGSDYAVTIGGNFGLTIIQLTYIFNGEVANTWTQGANTGTNIRSAGRYGTNNNVGFVGGISSSGDSPMNAHRIYDKTANTWSALANLPASRRDGIQYADGSGNVHQVGGEQLSSRFLSYYYYTQSTNTWATRTNIPSPVTQVVGYVGCNGITNMSDFVVVTSVPETVMLWDTAAGAWRRVGGNNSNYNIRRTGLTAEIADRSFSGMSPSAGTPTIQNVYVYTTGSSMSIAYTANELFINGAYTSSNYGSTKIQVQYNDRKIGIYTP